MNHITKIIFTIIPFSILFFSCNDTVVTEPEATETTYMLRLADGKTLPAFQYFLSIPDIDTGYIAIASEGSITIKRYIKNPENNYFKIRFGYGYGLKTNSSMESSFKTYEKQVPFQEFSDTLRTGYFTVSKSGDSLIVNYLAYHDDRPDLNMSHNFRLAFR